jgi:hypothetical protein
VKQIDQKLWLLSANLGAREFERIGRLQQLVEEAGDSALEETSSRRSGRRRSSGEPTAIWEVSGSQPDQAMALPSSMEVRMGDGWVEESTLRAASRCRRYAPVYRHHQKSPLYASLGAPLVGSRLFGLGGSMRRCEGDVWIETGKLSLGLIIPDFVHRV